VFGEPGRNHLVCCVIIYNSLATCHVLEKDDVLLTRSPISHSTTVVPSNRRNALALNTINRHTLILIDGRGREEGVLVWGGDVYCAILIGVASGSGVSYEGGINPITKFGGWKGDGVRNCRLTVTMCGRTNYRGWRLL
jgi:hypothetical protein